MKNRRPARESRDSSQRPATPARDALQPARAGRSASTSVSAAAAASAGATDEDTRSNDADDETFDDPEYDGGDVVDGVFEGSTFEDGDDAPSAGHGKNNAGYGKNDVRSGARGFSNDESEEFDDEPGSPLVRLNKYLASHGVASRRGCDVLITEGGVMVDDEIVTDLGVKIDPAVQRIEVDGVVLKPDGVRHRYYLLNKPSGVVCTNSERELRPRAVDLITDRDKGRLFTVGRLDEETTGLIILTNDGDFANRVMHPRYGVNKTYQVKVLGFVDDEAVQRIRDGVYLSEGITAGARVIVVRRAVSHTKLLVTIQEGKNREVRRVFARFGHKVQDLKRIKIGPLTDRGIKPGSWRPLKRAEIEALLSGPSEEDVQKERRNKKRHGRTGGVRRGSMRGGDRRGGGRDRRGSGDSRAAGEQNDSEAVVPRGYGRNSRDRRGLDPRGGQARVAPQGAPTRGADAPRSKPYAARSDERSETRGAARTERSSSAGRVTRNDQSEPRVQRRVIGGDSPRAPKREGNRIVGREAYKRVDGRAEPREGGRDDERRSTRGRGRDEGSQGAPRFGRHRSTGERRDERVPSSTSGGGASRGSAQRGARDTDDRRTGTRERAARSDRSDRSDRSTSGERRDSGGRNSTGANQDRSTRDSRSAGNDRTSRTGKRRGPETFVSPTGRRVIS